MAVILIILILVFGIVLSYYEIPQMLKIKTYRDIWIFSILLIFGIVIAILQSLKIPVPNPADWISWLFSPVSKILKDFLE